MQLRNLPNAKLFARYQADLRLRVRNDKNIKSITSFLAKFQDFLGSYPPSEELAKGFLAQYTDLKPHTWYNYVGEIQRFMNWYGEPIALKAKLPKSLPTYHEDSDIESILKVISQKKTHKNTIRRDTLLVELARWTGMRRAELSNLEVRDIHPAFLMVRAGKGQKDRMIPLLPDVAEKLYDFIKDMKPDEKVFKLGKDSVGIKITTLARRAGINNFHCHSLRHKYATDLLDHGVNIYMVQKLLGHENLNTTQVYLSVTDEQLREAVYRLYRGKTRPSRDEDAKIQEASADITLTPAPADPWTGFFERTAVGFFTIDITSNEIMIENLRVRTSDPQIPFQLMLFETDPQQIDDLENEDMVQMEAENRRVLDYPSGKAIPYTNRDKTMKLYGGLCIGQRGIPVKLLGEDTREQLKAHLQRPVEYSITLRYEVYKD